MRFASKLLRLKASLYSVAAASKVRLSQDSLLMRLLIDTGSWRRMDGGWLDSQFM